MGVTYVIPKSTASGTGSGGAWGDESVGMFGIGLPGTVRHELYEARDFVKEAAQNASNTAQSAFSTFDFIQKKQSAFSIFDFIQKNWKLLAVGAVALLVLLKD